jgi:hypothetical protein
MFNCDRHRVTVQFGANQSESTREIGRTETFWKELMKSESGISMIPTVKHSCGVERCEHRLSILKGI